MNCIICGKSGALMEDEDSITELPVLVHPECKKKAMRNSAYGEAVYTEK